MDSMASGWFHAVFDLEKKIQKQKNHKTNIDQDFQEIFSQLNKRFTNPKSSTSVWSSFTGSFLIW